MDVTVAPQGELSSRNDPVVFVDQFTRITPKFEGTAWVMPEDQFSKDRTNL